jgi:GMP synthase-like glutamine amidotransferase
VPLATSVSCLQAFRYGGRAWGLQFHPEVTRSLLQSWIDQAEAGGVALEHRTFERECDEHADAWEELGRRLVTGFLGVAARAHGAERVRV